jgi:hypothetical protein
VWVALGAGLNALASYAAALSALAIALAERGRRGAARAFFPALITLHAPLWVLERSISVYWALYWRIFYGGYPFGDKLLSKGTGTAWVPGGRLSSMGVTYGASASAHPNERR